jgi:hypothetical protein
LASSLSRFSSKKTLFFRKVFRKEKKQREEENKLKVVEPKRENGELSFEPWSHGNS